MERKHKQRVGKLVRMRYYQFLGLLGSLFFYLFVYRKFLYPTPVMSSAAYGQALAFIK